MIHYHFSGKPDDSHFVLDVDLTQAFEGTHDMTDFVSNCGVEAQTALLAILTRMYDNILTILAQMGTPESEQLNHLLRDHLIASTICGVDAALFLEFRDGLHGNEPSENRSDGK